MQKYILDTNIISLLGAKESKENKLIYNRFLDLEDGDMVMTSVVTLYEVYYGMKNSNSTKEQNEIKQNIEFIQRYFEIVPLDMREMEYFAISKCFTKNTQV